jgi:streptomycin 6-kinase
MLTPTSGQGGSELIELNPSLVANLNNAHGPAVGAWLDALPALVAGLASVWGLREIRPLASRYSGYSVILEARSAEHGPVVVKLVPPQEDGQDREALTLTAWDGRGAVRLVERDIERQALLLSRLLPGTPLDPTQLGDDTATRALAEVGARLAVQPTAEVAARLPGVGIWGEDFDAYLATYGSGGPIDHDLVGTARRLLTELLATAPEPVLLHGDLHHDNVLRDGDAWVAIDPKGYIGDPACEPSQTFANPRPYVRPMGASALTEHVERRLACWSACSALDMGRVRDWAVVKCVLSDVWSVEDHDRVDGLPSRVAWELLARDRG